MTRATEGRTAQIGAPVQQMAGDARDGVVPLLAKDEEAELKLLVDSGSDFEKAIGYSRAVVVGDQVFVSGTTGFAYETMTISESVRVQAEQCITNLKATLEAVGCSLSDVVRVRYMLTNASDFPQTWPVLQEAFGTVRPAATMTECGLADPRMKIEIEVDALSGSGALRSESLRV